MLVSLQTRKLTTKQVIAFTKTELNAILSVYAFQVAKGIWRDYAIDFMSQMAVFSIFRHSGEQAFVSIVKLPGNTATGFIYEVFKDKKRLSRSATIESALSPLHSQPE